MALITWNQSLSVHIERIDEQHKKLISLLNLLHEAVKSGKGGEVLSTILRELVNYTANHFSLEEELMTKYNYPSYKNHLKEHDDFRAKTRDLLMRYDSSTSALSIEVLNFLKDWITVHIKDTDKQYEKFFQQHGIN